jgi:hypothetical protein
MRCLTVALGAALTVVSLPRYSNGWFLRGAEGPTAPVVADPSPAAVFLKGPGLGLGLGLGISFLQEQSDNSAAPAGAPAPAAPYGPEAPSAPEPILAATPGPTTPNPDPWYYNLTFPIGPHPRTVNEIKAVKTSRGANDEAQHALNYAKYLDEKLQRAVREHARVIKPFTDPPPVNFSDWWPHARSLDPRWVAPPMAHDIARVMRNELQWASLNVSRQLPPIVRGNILRATMRMIDRMKANTQGPTTLPPTTTTTTTTEPPPPPPPEPPAAAPAPGPAPGPSGPSGPSGPAGAPGGAMMYVMGVDGQYYMVPMSPGMTTTAGPTTPGFTTTPRYVMGADGLFYLAPADGVNGPTF